jgi:hypothetical protein
VNKSRADYRAIITKIPLQVEDLSKIPQLSNDINNMLTSNGKVFLGKDVPYCFLSRIESSFAELTLGYNLKNMVHNSSESLNYYLSTILYYVCFTQNDSINPLFVQCFWKNYSQMTL